MSSYLGAANVPTTKCRIKILQFLLGGMNNSLAQSTRPETAECKLLNRLLRRAEL